MSSIAFHPDTHPTFGCSLWRCLGKSSSRPRNRREPRRYGGGRMELNQIVADLASALRAVDAAGPREGEFAPGIGPFSEPHALAMASQHLATAKREYVGAGPRHRIDLVIPGQWIIEVKLIRPFGDNG